MKHRIFQRIRTGVVVIPLFIVVSTTPAHAVLRIDPSSHRSAGLR